MMLPGCNIEDGQMNKCFRQEREYRTRYHIIFRSINLLHQYLSSFRCNKTFTGGDKKTKPTEPFAFEPKQELIDKTRKVR